MSPEQVLAWVEATYGVQLNDEQIQQLAAAIGFNGSNWSPEMAQAAQNLVAQVAQENNIPARTGGVGGATGGGMGSGTGSSTGGGTGGGIDTAGAESFKAWFRQTFGREATDQELGNYAQGARYSGGTITPTTLAQLKDAAILDQKAKGWLPVQPNQFAFTPFEYEQFRFGEQAPTFQGMEAFQFNEQTPTFQAGPAFQYQEFQAPNLDDVMRDPAYQRRLAEGRKALETSAAAKGLLRTGATLKGLTQFGQELASEEYGKTYDRARGEYQQGYNRAMDEYQSGETQRRDQFNAARQAYLDRRDQAQMGYQTEAARRSAQYGSDVEAWRNRYGQAREQYETNRSNAMTNWQAQRQEEGLRWQRDYDVWRYLNDDAYRRAQIAASQT